MEESNGNSKVIMHGVSISDSKAESITCSGSTTVGPNAMVDYDIEQTIVNETYRTYTDIKFTKCSFFFRKDSEKSLSIDDTEHFIYQYNVPGILMVKQAQKCSVRFYNSVPLNPSSKKCDAAQKSYAYEYDTYTPQCVANSAGGYDWRKCQCDYGFALTQATCNCVDPTNGILIPGKSHVMDGKEDWHKWCDDNCGTYLTNENALGSFKNASAAKKVDDIAELINIVKDTNSKENDKMMKFINNIKNKDNNNDNNLNNNDNDDKLLQLIKMVQENDNNDKNYYNNDWYYMVILLMGGFIVLAGLSILCWYSKKVSNLKFQEYQRVAQISSSTESDMI